MTNNKYACAKTRLRRILCFTGLNRTMNPTSTFDRRRRTCHLGIYFFGIAVCTLICLHIPKELKLSINNIETSLADGFQAVSNWVDNQLQEGSILRIRKPQVTDFQTIENSSAFGYSAYLDERPARDIPPGNGPVIRIFVYLLRHINPTTDWMCLLHFSWQQQSKWRLTSVLAVTDLNHSPQLRYRVVMLLCALPSDAAFQSPHHVSIVTMDYLRKYSTFLNGSTNTSNSICKQRICDINILNVDIRNATCNNYLNNTHNSNINNNTMDWVCLSSSHNLIPVTDLRREREHHNDSSTVNFTVCVSPLFGESYDWKDVLKFIEINKQLGANKFIFYISSTVNRSLKEYLKNYSLDVKRDNCVEVYPFNPLNPNGLHYNGQIICITECLYRAMYRTRYLTSQDLDELIVPMKARSWSDMMAELNEMYPGKNIAAANFRNVWFPTKSPNDSVYGNNSAAVRYNIEPLLKTTCDSYIFPHSDRSKVMLRPESVLIVHVHYVEDQNIIDLKNNPNIYVSEKEALLFHYRDTNINFNTAPSNKRLHQYADVIQERVQSEMKHFSRK